MENNVNLPISNQLFISTIIRMGGQSLLGKVTSELGEISTVDQELPASMDNSEYVRSAIMAVYKTCKNEPSNITDLSICLLWLHQQRTAFDKKPIKVQ